MATKKFKKIASILPITNHKIPRELSSPCPFCGKTFIRLGNHISKCTERDGRDYLPNLAKKTLDKKARSELPKKLRCPKCHKLFLRLDTHLRKNPFCKSVKDFGKVLTSDSCFQPLSNNPSETIPQTSLLIDIHSPTLASSTELTNSQLQLEPQSHNKHSMHNFPNAHPPSQSLTFLSCQTTTYIQEKISSTTPPYTLAGTLTPSISAGHHNSKYPIKLPGSEAEWMEADKHFLVYLLPAVQLASCVEDKYKILADGIFNFFSSRYGCHRRKEKNNSKPSKGPKHDRALKKIKQLKTKAGRDFRHAKKNGALVDDMQTLAKNFFNLVWQQSKMVKKSRAASMSQSIRQELSLCHNSFWKYVKHLFDNNTAKRINPAFAEDKAFPFFKSVYSSQPNSFHQPPGMPSAKDPVFNFNESPFSIEEIRSTIIRSNASSTPSPLDQIPYRILKRCPSLVHALFKLYNQCWQTSTIPQAWKTASIRLIAKGSAKDDPSSPSNFRPIALTSCIRKIFISILKSRWSTYMLEN